MMHHRYRAATALAAALALGLTGWTASSASAAPTRDAATGTAARGAALPPSVKQLTDAQVRALPEYRGLGPLPRLSLGTNARVVVTQDGLITLPGGARAQQWSVVACPGGTAVLGTQGQVWFIRTGTTQVKQVVAGGSAASMTYSPDRTQVAVLAGTSLSVHRLPDGALLRRHILKTRPFEPIVWNSAGIVYGIFGNTSVINPTTGATRTVKSHGGSPAIISGKDPRVELFTANGPEAGRS